MKGNIVLFTILIVKTKLEAYLNVCNRLNVSETCNLWY